MPAHAFPAGRSTVQLRASLQDGNTVYSEPFQSLDDPDTTAWPFPAQPAPGRAGSQLALLLLAALLCALLPHAAAATREAGRLALVGAGGASLLPFTAANRLHVVPPAVLTAAEAEQGIAIIDQALGAVFG